jgi:dTDP-4-dehydrorhamnose reductase
VKILILGTGYIAQSYEKFLWREGIQYHILSRSSFDYTKKDKLVSFLNNWKPDIVLNTAGYVGRPNVDACENHQKECLIGNVVLVQTIAEACKLTGNILLHVSSGCIFTGNNGEKGFSEKDEPNFTFKQNNCSFYSGTKAMAEEILKTYSYIYIFRLRMPFNHKNNLRNYLSKVLSYHTLLDAKNSLTNINDFVRASVETFNKSLPFGIYNITNPGSITTRQITEMMIERGLKKEFRFFENEEEFNKTVVAPRSNCVLDSSKILNYGIGLENVKESVGRCLDRWIV